MELLVNKIKNDIDLSQISVHFNKAMLALQRKGAHFKIERKAFTNLIRTFC